ncbi:MAG: molecular chaperone HtpG [Peptoniphilaceae bacterium]|nr:molecular chaperone HtpG [Peptoniphilaceae bacterium]MDD7383213.1 molecular chaperone HtpG [Peptoniphilaceae bacterium]MDY3738437.1 molecular chaperone HtpG [Peptoniphilaceae bacterium]
MKKEFKAEAKRVMDLMINSIYTNKEIFLRELISNASDALDKLYYKDLKSDKETDKEKFYIKIKTNKDSRTISVEDTGIGMNKEEMENNLGTIATSGTALFRNEVESESDVENLIGQFGVGFYSAFMVADKVEVLSKKDGENDAYLWTSENADGYEIIPSEKETNGTIITLFLKEDKDGENYSDFLEEYRLRSLIEKYSNYIRYPIKMNVTKTKYNEEEKDEDKKYETYVEEEVLNSKKPIWKRNKKDLTDDDYINFYRDQHYGFDEPLKWIHLNIEGAVEFKAILYIPKKAPFDYYSKDYKKGLELYSNGVKIMDRAEELLNEEFSFVKGVVDSESISLNISRETLQQDRQLRFISKQINKKIEQELKNMIEKDRENYEIFYNQFKSQLKMSLYESYGAKKELLDLLLFNSKKHDKLVTLKEYKEEMPSTQEYIYYVTSDSLDKAKNLPQLSFVDENNDVLLFTDQMDEFVIKMVREYEEKEFKSVSQLDEKEDEKEDEIYTKIKDILPDDVVDISISENMGENPVTFMQKGDISIDMEKTLSRQPNSQANGIKAQKVLQINKNSKAYNLFNKALESENKDEIKKITNILYNQARIIEGLDLDNPTEYVKDIRNLLE